MSRDKRWYNMVKIPYVRNFGERKREMREKHERRERWERMGLKAPFYIFLADLGTLKHRRLPRAWLGFRFFLSLSWERAGARGRVLEHAFMLEPKEIRLSVAARLPELVFLPFLISKTPRAIILHLFTFKVKVSFNFTLH